MKMLTVILFVVQSFLPLFYNCCDASKYHNLHHYGPNILQEAENTIDVLHDERLRRSLTPHLVIESNCTNCSDQYQPIDHKYYESLFVKNGERYWRELRGSEGTLIHHLLSDSYLAKKIYKMKFGFPYYGHILHKVMLTTGGFLYMDELDTKFLTDVQYVAPLMAQFNPHLRESSDVLTNDDGEKLTVQWSGVHLHDNPSVGAFSFQCTLHKNGSIWFAYKQIPIPIGNITGVDYHPVRVGIADAFVIRKQHIRTRVIYRFFYVYSEVNITASLIVNGSAVIFTPKKTCVTGSDCEGCIMLTSTSAFNCFWCPQTKKCSDGADRNREEWEREGCSASAVKELTDGKCAVSGKKDNNGIGAGAIVAIVVVLLLVVAVATWCVYAYKYPNSKSGLFLIEATSRPKKLFSRSSGGDGQSTTAAPSDVKPQVL